MAVYRDCSNVLGTPYYLRTGEATDFRFGQYIHRVHLNKSILKILEKRECPEVRDDDVIYNQSKS